MPDVTMTRAEAVKLIEAHEHVVRRWAGAHHDKIEEAASEQSQSRESLIAALTRPAPSPSDADLIRRLRGEYRIPITDGLGAAGGEEPDNPNEFVRRFETPPIQHEAADRLEVLARMRGAAVPEGAGTFVQAGHVKFPESREEADAMILVAEAWIKAHQTPAAPAVPR